MSAPTLLIGLGGTGSKVIERVAKLVTKEQLSNIAFAVFDTDINELREIEKRSPFVKTIQTSTRQTVGDYLNQDTHARDTWFPVNAILNGKVLTEGAGQVRSVSRLAFESAVRAGKLEPLHKAIQSLYKVEEDKGEQALRVVIVSSLAGGTGSGLILPVALYLQNYLKINFRSSANITRGFFILPEVFYEVIPSQTERNNLKANAYATLRELDAFLMKGDEMLHEKFCDSVKIEFPRAASTGYEEINIRPYDYCFLFDAQNADGGKLNSFNQYLDHAANCIYCQSIGPMNKRSNSSEDNTIRGLVREKGRNRYAGAGASMLIYPYEDVRTYIALNWAEKCISSRWLEFDNAYREICLEAEESRESGIAIDPPELSSFYVQQIESAAAQENPFAKAIVNSCLEYSDSVTVSGRKWETFIGRLLGKVEFSVNKDSNPALSSSFEDASSQIADLGVDWSEYAATYTSITRYRLLSAKIVEEIQQSLAYTLFQPPKADSFDKQLDYKLENYLRKANGEFLHPNAVRYLLIKICQQMEACLVSVDSEKEDGKNFFDTFEKATFDDPGTEDVIEDANSLGDRKVSVFAKWSKHPSGDQEDIKGKYRLYLSKVEEYSTRCAQSYVLKKGITYIKSQIDALECFYKMFTSKVEGIEKKINEIHYKYGAVNGTTAKYVCASANCLEKTYEKYSFDGSSISIDSELAQKIYTKVLEYSQITDKPNNNKYFSDLFDEDILGYFDNSVMKKYGNSIDIDIISAIEREAEFENDLTDMVDPDEFVRQYIIKTIEDTRTLSCPFIESPLGGVRQDVNACAYNKELDPKQGDETDRAQLIKTYLGNFGGTPDEDIPHNMIMFYRSFYGLRANDLSKFAPPEKSLTNNRPGGEYFTAYYELINGIHPETILSKELSPHIDRWWHIVTKMPDLDDENQKKQEELNYAAFFWGILGRLIDLYEDNAEQRTYKVKSDVLNLPDPKLTVSNGTDCDKLYEVLDAIAIYPELANTILNYINETIEDEVNLGSPLEEGILFTGLSLFDVSEPTLGRSGQKITSIFSIPVLMRKSATPSLYYEENVILLLKTEIEEIRKYLAEFLNEKELPAVFGRIIIEHFDKYLNDIAVEKEMNALIYKESLFDRTCSILESTLRSMKLFEEAKYIQNSVAKLKKE